MMYDMQFNNSCYYIVKLRYSGYLVKTDQFFPTPAEYLLISVCDNMVRTDSVSMDFSL